MTVGSTAYFVARSCETIQGKPLLSADEDVLYPLDYVLLLKVTFSPTKFEVKQLYVDVDKWACKVYLPEIADGKMTVYIFGQQVNSGDCI